MPLDDQKKSDEIDFIDLIVKAVIVVKSNIVAIILLFLLGIAIGAAYFFVPAKVYHSRMIISSSILTTSYTRVLFENATRLLAEGSFETLANQFKVPVDVVRNIRSLSIENISRAPGEEMKDSERFVITVDITDQKIIQELQKGILTYLENNEFVKVRVQQMKYFNTQMLEGVEKEIKDLEDFKKKITDGSFFQTNKGNVMFDPTTVNSKILELTEKKIQYKNALELSNSVQLIDGFSEFKKTETPKLAVALSGGAVLGLVLVGLFLVIKTVRKMVAIAEQKHTA